jgi:hypothetical protein
MDLSKLSDDDLMALKSGDLSRMSDAGLMALKGEPAKQGPSGMDLFKAELKTSLPGGLVRGMKDIVDTGAQGAAWLYDKATGGNQAQQVKAMNEAGGADFKAAQDLVGAGGSNVTRVGGQIIGTAPVGGVFGKVAEVAKAPSAIVNALRSGGMFTGSNPVGVAAKAGDLAIRTGAGAAVGGASAALTNPEDYDTGALIGALLPGGMQLAGKAGETLGNYAAKGVADKAAAFARNAPKNETVRQAVEAGYVLPPNLVRPSTKNRIIESISGKQATSQLVSDRNTETTGRLVRRALGLADDVPLTVGELNNLRNTAGKAYADVSALSPKAAEDLEALKVARNEAQAWFKAYNQSARPDDLAKAKEFRALSDSLEGALEQHAKDAGKDELIPLLRDARKQIAKTYTVERSLSKATGEIAPNVLARLYEKGTPLSDGLDVVGRTASAFPSALKTSQQTGSPAAHNLQHMASVLLGTGGGITLGFPGAAAAAIPYASSAAARSMMFRPGAQRALVQSAPETTRAAQLAEMLVNPQLQQLLQRSAPVISAQ